MTIARVYRRRAGRPASERRIDPGAGRQFVREDAFAQAFGNFLVQGERGDASGVHVRGAGLFGLQRRR